MRGTVYALISTLLEEGQEFLLTAPKDKFEFYPALDPDIYDSMDDLVVMSMVNYPLETTAIDDKNYIISFETGFGENPSAPTMVSLKMLDIYMLRIGPLPLYVNTAALIDRDGSFEEKSSNDFLPTEKEAKRSFDSFRNNPENAKFFKGR